MSKNAAEMTRKEMKGPDAFQAAAAKGAEWVAGHQKQIVYGVVAAIGLFAVAVGVSSLFESRHKAAGGLLYLVLDDAGGQISSVPLPGVVSPTFPSAEAQQRSVVARAAELRKAYPSSEASRTAAIVSGSANLRLQAWDAAAADFEAFLAGGDPKDSLAVIAREGIARAKEGKGDLAGALAVLERIQAEVPAHADRAAMERARLLARQGKAGEARQILEAFPKDFKDSQLRPEAEQRLARLGGAK
jgi:predicted negative regulator of RcsB-dependent stress response